MNCGPNPHSASAMRCHQIAKSAILGSSAGRVGEIAKARESTSSIHPRISGLAFPNASQNSSSVFLASGGILSSSTGTPFGYRNIRFFDEYGRIVHDVGVIEDEAKMVHEAFEMRLDGKQFKEIAQHFVKN